MTSCERSVQSVQAKKQLEREVTIKQNGLQHEDDKILDDQSQYEKDDDHNAFDCDLTNGDKFKSDSDNLSSNMSLDSMSEVDVEEDCLIEILPVPEPEDGKRNELNKELLELLQEEGTVEDLLSDVNEISGEDNLIEIDISMGSIRQSGCGIGT